MMKDGFAGVRIATPADVNGIYNLLMLLHAENGLAPLSPSKVHQNIITLCDGKSGGVVGVIEGERGIEASVGLILSQWWYTDEHHLEEIWTFVHPDYRKTTHAKRLIEFAKWCSDQLGVKLTMGILTTSRLAPKMRLYQRQMPQIGALFVHGPDKPAELVNQRDVSHLNIASDTDAGYVRN